MYILFRTLCLFRLPLVCPIRGAPHPPLSGQTGASARNKQPTTKQAAYPERFGPVVR